MEGVVVVVVVAFVALVMTGGRVTVNHSCFTIAIGTGADQHTANITITPTMTLSELVDEINTASDGRFNASLVNVGTETNPQYRLMVGGVETGLFGTAVIKSFRIFRRSSGEKYGTVDSVVLLR